MSPSTPELADPERLEALERTGLIGAPPQESIDRIVSLARRLLRVPTARLTLVDEHREIDVSRIGETGGGAAPRGAAVALDLPAGRRGRTPLGVQRPA